MWFLLALFILTVAMDRSKGMRGRAEKAGLEKAVQKRPSDIPFKRYHMGFIGKEVPSPPQVKVGKGGWLVGVRLKSQ